MSLDILIMLFCVMLVLALIPGVSVLTVSARSATYGLIHGIFTTLGIMAGDIFFILIAILGLTLLAEKMGDLFVLVKYLGGSYLIWFGITLWRSITVKQADRETLESSLHSSFLAGLFITLADQKAILFYLGFFPGFFDLSTLGTMETGVIIAIAVTALGLAKLFYAILAIRASEVFKNSGAIRGINRVAGILIIGVGVYLIAMT